MILEFIAWLIISFSLLRLGVAVSNCFARPFLRKYPISRDPLVSILIPARNEASNLPILLEGIMNQDYVTFELIVYDDHSEDDTASVVEEYSLKDGRIRWVSGKPLPAGWTGKNFACHRLAGEARGEVLLFLDADVRVSKHLLRRSLGYFTHHDLALLSIFPHQIMKTTGEWLTVPLMNWILLSLLPLVLVRKSSRSSLSAANGQFMMFDARVYRKHQWHEQVRQNLVEDILISRKMKEMNHHTATLLGNNDVMCRMYTSYRDGVNGFAKNVLEFFGGNITTAAVFTFFTFTGVVIVPLAWGWQGFALYIFTIIFTRVFISLTSKQDVWKNLLFHIPQMVSFLVILMRGIQVKYTKQYQWKGRKTGA